MTNDEARFILAAYRPGSQDATDPLFASSLAQARRDPVLRAWFEAQRAFDAVISARLLEVNLPPYLREEILAVARLSMRPGRRPRIWRYLAAAAAVAILLAVPVARRTRSTPPALHDLTHRALRDTATNGSRHTSSHAAMQAIELQLARVRLRSGGGLELDLAQLRANGCRRLPIAGREVFEICFGRDPEFHLYVARREDFAVDAADEPAFSAQGPLSAATWADARLVYTLVTTAGTAALRQQL